MVAAMCILAVRAVIVQLAFFLHIQVNYYSFNSVYLSAVLIRDICGSLLKTTSERNEL